MCWQGDSGPGPVDSYDPPHPDSQPWRKACGECAFRRGNPQMLSEEDFDWMYLQEALGGFSFTCAHRTDDGYYRECACWASIQLTRRREQETGS